MGYNITIIVSAHIFQKGAAAREIAFGKRIARRQYPNMIDFVRLVDWMLVGQLICAFATFLAVVCALFQQRIADYWRNKPNVIISSKYFSVTSHGQANEQTPYEIKIVDGKPTFDGKLIDDINSEKDHALNTHVEVIDLIKGKILTNVYMPYLDVYIENGGYYDVIVDGFYVEYFGGRKRRPIINSSRDNVIKPVSFRYKDLLYSGNDGHIISCPDLPAPVKAGDDIQFRIDPQKIKQVCERSGKYASCAKDSRKCRDYLAFTIITGKHVIRQCSRIRLSAILGCGGC
jgi:hypothetical protein